MKMSTAFRKGSEAYGSRLGATLKFGIVELCLHLITLAPLLLWAEPSLRLLMLFCLPLFVFLLLPARVNSAAAMQDALAGGSLFSLRLADPEGYGKKVVFGLSRCGLVALWAAPLIASLLIAKAHISGEMDGFTLMRMIKAFGGDDLVRGFIYLGLIFAGTLVLWAVGCGRHCGDRHAWVLGDMKRLKGQRGKMLWCWFCSLIILLPLLVALLVLIIRYAPVFADLNGLLFETVELPNTKISLVILAVGGVLTLPLVPLRSLVIGAYVSGLKEKS